MEMNMGNTRMLNTAIQAVINYYNQLDGDIVEITKHDVYVVWFCKTLQNYKVILSMPLLNNMFFEFTYNGDKQEAYLDVYKKVHNQVIDLK